MWIAVAIFYATIGCWWGVLVFDGCTEHEKQHRRCLGRSEELPWRELCKALVFAIVSGVLWLPFILGNIAVGVVRRTRK